MSPLNTAFLSKLSLTRFFHLTEEVFLKLKFLLLPFLEGLLPPLFGLWSGLNKLKSSLNFIDYDSFFKSSLLLIVSPFTYLIMIEPLLIHVWIPPFFLHTVGWIKILVFPFAYYSFKFSRIPMISRSLSGLFFYFTESLLSLSLLLLLLSLLLDEDRSFDTILFSLLPFD